MDEIGIMASFVNPDCYWYILLQIHFVDIACSCIQSIVVCVCAKIQGAGLPVCGYVCIYLLSRIVLS